MRREHIIKAVGKYMDEKIPFTKHWIKTHSKFELLQFIQIMNSEYKIPLDEAFARIYLLMRTDHDVDFDGPHYHNFETKYGISHYGIILKK
jgi:hypothetical protein